MNYLKYLLGTVALTSSVACAQTMPTTSPVTQPMAGANLITVATTDDLPTAIATARRVLQTQGYALDSVSSDRLTTKGRAVTSSITGGASATVVQVFRVRLYVTPQGGSRLAITGEYSQDMGPKYHFTFPMRWLAPQNPSDNQACFQRADAIAKAYPRGTVSYAKQP